MVALAVFRSTSRVPTVGDRRILGDAFAVAFDLVGADLGDQRCWRARDRASTVSQCTLIGVIRSGTGQMARSLQLASAEVSRLV
jgi:hypothetical protein